MPAPAKIDDLSTTAASNYPAGTDIPSTLDDGIRALASVVKQTHVKGTDITAAATITIPDSGSYFVVTGSTGISAINDRFNGFSCTLKFSSTPILTHSSGLILPGSANITAAAGDVAEFVNESSGVWRCVAYQKASGAAITGGSGAITSSAFTMSTGKVLGRDTASTGAIEELSLSEVLDLIGSAAQGDILYRDASGWARLGAGTSGYFLKTQGSGANPTWAANTQTVSTLVAPASVNNVASITITDIPAAARAVEIDISFLAPVSDNVDFLMQTSTDNGSTYDSSAGNYQYANTENTVGGSISNTNSSASSTALLIAKGMGNATNENGAGRIRIHYPGNAQYCFVEWESICRNQSSGTLVKTNGGGCRLAVADVDAVKLVFSTGNINSARYSAIYW